MNLWMCVSQHDKAAVGSACVCRWCGPSIILKHFPMAIWNGFVFPSLASCAPEGIGPPLNFEKPVCLSGWSYECGHFHPAICCWVVDFPLKQKSEAIHFGIILYQVVKIVCVWRVFLDQDIVTWGSFLRHVLPWGVGFAFDHWPHRGWAAEHVKFEGFAELTIDARQMEIQNELHNAATQKIIYRHQDTYVYTNSILSTISLEVQFDDVFRRAWGWVPWKVQVLGRTSQQSRCGIRVSSASPVELWNCQVIDTSMLGRELSIPASPFLLCSNCLKELVVFLVSQDT